MKKRNKILLILSCFMIGIFLTSCKKSSTSSGKKVTLHVTSFGGSYDKTFEKGVVKPFEKAHPNVKVKLVPYTTVTKMEQGGAKGIDIVQLDDFDLVSAGNKGYLSSISSKNIGDFKNLYPQAKLYGKNRKLYGIANVFGAWGIAYNPKKVSKPTSWNDLLNKKYSGKVTAMSQYLPDILMVSRANGGNYKNMSPAWKFYKKLTPNVAKYYTSFSDPESLFESGDVEIASWFSGRAEALKEEGKSVDFVIPKEGGELIRSVLGIVKTSKNKKLDEELIEYSLRQKAQAAFAKDLYYGPTNKKIKIPSYISKDVVNQREIERLYAPNWNKVLKYSGSWYTKQTALTTSK